MTPPRSPPRWRVEQRLLLYFHTEDTSFPTSCWFSNQIKEPPLLFHSVLRCPRFLTV